MKEAGAKSTAELIALLKFGEYEGADLMHTWCRLRQLDAENSRLRSALDDCRTAPFETVDQIRAYARLVLEGGDE